MDFRWERSLNDRTYIRQYRRKEVLEILENVRLEFVAFDKVVHDLQRPRLLVVTTKSY